MHKIIHFFDKLEDQVRGNLTRFPIIYTLIGGVAIVLFWRGVWHTADILQARGGLWGILLYEPVSMIIVVIVLLLTGLFVSYFIGDSILITGAKSQRKLAEKTSKEILEEETTIADIKQVVDSIKVEVEEIKREVEGKK
jgi:uncharacterized membrane protein